MDTPAFPATTEISLFGGPFDGETVSICGRPYEYWVPNDDPQMLPLNIDPTSYCRTFQWVAVYTRVADKNQYKFLEMRRD
jgi:hypothetical protein